MKKMKKFLLIVLIIVLTPVMSFAATGNNQFFQIKEETTYDLNMTMLEGTDIEEPAYDDMFTLKFVPEKTGCYLLNAIVDDMSPQFYISKSPSDVNLDFACTYERKGNNSYYLTAAAESVNGQLMKFVKGKAYYIFVSLGETEEDGPKNFKLTYAGSYTAASKAIHQAEKGQTIPVGFMVLKSGIKLKYRAETSRGKVLKADGYEIYRGNKLYGNFKKVGTTTKTVFFDKKADTHKINRHYYKILGYRLIDGKKYYIPWRVDFNGLPLRIDCY